MPQQQGRNHSGLDGAGMTEVFFRAAGRSIGSFLISVTFSRGVPTLSIPVSEQERFRSGSQPPESTLSPPSVFLKISRRTMFNSSWVRL